jgi:hypothetical protein
MMNDFDMKDMIITEKTDGALFGKYQLLLGDKRRAERAYEALLEDAEFYKTTLDFLHDVYHVVQDRMLESSARLNNKAMMAQEKSNRYYKSGNHRMGRQFANYSRRLFQESKDTREQRNKILLEMKTIQREFNKANDDANAAFEISIRADNKFYEYCRRINNRIAQVLRQ